MIKLYDDQKLEIIKELKEYHNKSVKYVNDLREQSETKEWLKYLDLANCEIQLTKLAKLIEDVEKDLNAIDNEKWVNLLSFVSISEPSVIYDFDSSFEIEDKESGNGFANLNTTGVLGIIALSAIFGGNDWGFKIPLTNPKDNKDLN